MDRVLLLKYKYLLTGIISYLLCVTGLCLFFNQALTDFIPGTILFVIIFPILAQVLTKDNNLETVTPGFKTEPLILFLLVVLITSYVTFLSSYINNLLPEHLIKNARFMMFFVSGKKLFVFVFIPWLVYKIVGLSVINLNYSTAIKGLFSGRNIIILILFSLFSVIFQLLFSKGGERFLSENYQFSDYLIGIPLTFLYLVVDVGLVEEFFFRGILAARIGTLTKSNAGGVLISSIIFGLIHAPGLFLRGAESEGIEEALPFIFFLLYTLVFMAAGGIFLGILYNRTRSLLLVIILHSVLDLIPNFNEFVEIWLR